MKHPSILIFAFFMTACGDADEKLERIARSRADSLFLMEKKQLDMKMDSSCKAKAENQFQHTLDSIVEKRKYEIIKLQQDL